MDYRAIFKHMPDDEGILITGEDYAPVFTCGIAEALVENGRITDWALPILKEALKGLKTDLPADGKHYRLQARRAADNGHTYYVFWVKDESEAAEAERKLHYCLEVLDNINEGIIVTDKNGEIIIYNKKLGEFEDLNKDEVIGQQLKDVYDAWSAESKRALSGAQNREGDQRREL